eukprot:Skav203879  [mRNA]  locus=scaffold252:78020:79714:+ [translate_table: standard]
MTENNAERDCQRLMVNKLQLALPIHQSELETADGPSVPILKLRTWLDYFLQGNHTHLLVGLKSPDWSREAAVLKAFWANFEKQEPSHPIFQKARDGQLHLQRTFPMLMHGDEGRGRKRTAFLVLNFHSLLGRGIKTQRKGKKTEKKKNRKQRWLRMRPNYQGHTFTSRYLFAALPKALYTGENGHVWDALMLAAAEEAKFVFETGVADSHHGRGQFHMAIIRICGDWPFLTDSGCFARSFRNVQKHKTRSKPPGGICHQCAAGQIGYDFEELNTLRPKWLSTMFTQPLVNAGDVASPLSEIPHPPGQVASLWTYDIFHTWHIGIGRCYLASMLVLLAELEAQTNIDDRFQSLTVDFFAFCKRTSRRKHVLKITKDLVGYPTSNHYPNATWHKGDLTTVLMAYVEHRFEQDGATWDPMLQLSGRAAVYINTCFRAMYKSDAWLSPPQARKIGNDGLKFLKAYATLARMAHDRGRMLWILQPKHHALHHIFVNMVLSADNGPVLNAVCFGTQPDEDFIGRPSRLSRRVTAIPEQCCKRVVSRYLQNCYSQWLKVGLIVRPQAEAKE